MVHRFSWLAGLAGILFALARLERLLRPSVEGLPWEVVLLAAAVLGGGITWAALAFRLSAPAVVAANLIALLLTVVRVAVPATTWFVFPTLESFPALGTELAYALDVSRTGVAPVLPLPGIVALLAIIFWLLGTLLAVGLRSDRPYPAVLAPLVVYLQFATMDRRAGGLWMVGFLALLGLALLAVAADRRQRGTGRLTIGPARATVRRSQASLAAGALALVVGLTLASTGALAGTLPRSGLLDWRVPSALTGDYYGSISYNPFVGIQQQLIDPSDTPLLIAEITGEVPYDRVYFRLLTLEAFNGTRWHTDGQRLGRPEEVEGFEDADAAFRGPTARVTQAVTILALQQEWLPAAYSPTAFAAENRAVSSGFRIKLDDGALRFDAFTYRGMTYTVESRVPVPDLAILALDATGRPSPVFAAASAAEPGYEVVAAASPPPTYELPERDRFLGLPPGIDTGIRSLANGLVRDLSTDFEKALALEAYFRDSGDFTYSIEVAPGHAATDLAEWLLDPASPNFRTGYCEQFATAMAVMARLVGLPTRVVLGFTPGWQHTDGRVVVSDRNAHAWVEIWMPTQGWVPFDPTPRGDGVNPATSDGLPFDFHDHVPEGTTTPTLDFGTGPTRPQPPEDTVTSVPTTAAGQPGSGWDLPPAALWSLAAPALGLGLIPALKWGRRRSRLRSLSSGDVSGVWREVIDRLSDLGDEPRPGATPAEVAAATDDALLPLARIYAESIYGPARLGPPDLRRFVAASRSFAETGAALARRYSRWRRLASWYRLRSLAPRRWRRHRHG